MYGRVEGVDATTVIATAEALYGFLADQLEQRRAAPGDDLLSLLLEGDVNGRPYTQDEILDLAFFLVIAGIENTAFSIRATLRHLAVHPGGPRRARCGSGVDQQRRGAVAAPLRAGHRAVPDGRRATRASVARSCEPATACCCCSVRPTATRQCSRTPTISTSTGAMAGMSRSASARTAASARTWRASRSASRSRSCCAGCRTSSSRGPTPAGTRPARWSVVWT